MKEQWFVWGNFWICSDLSQGDEYTASARSWSKDLEIFEQDLADGVPRALEINERWIAFQVAEKLKS
jgi:hypothetical protein